MVVTNQWPSGTDATAGLLNTRSIPVVSATTDITAPFTGQVIFCTTDNMLYRYSGSAWVAFLATGGPTAATQLHEARYEQRTLQAIPTTTDTKIKFETPVTTCNDVTASGTGNTDFLLNRAGLWVITASLRFNAATSGERHIFPQTGTTFAVANRFASQTAVNVGTAPATVATASAIRVTAGTSVCVGAWQNNGSSINTDVGFGGTNHVDFAWLRP
jgi:hypothetical protein